jgi:hypothetical protein
MNIVVCVKQVPDTAAERKLKSGDATLDRGAVDGLINELDEYAIEEALQIAEAHGGEVTVLSMGPERAAESIRKALSMGRTRPCTWSTTRWPGRTRWPPPTRWRRCCADVTDYVTAPEAGLLASLVRGVSPAAVLLAATGQNKEVAGRPAVKTNSGVLADATGLAAQDGKIVAEQSVFGGATVVHSAVRQGTPVITVRPNSVAPEPAPGRPEANGCSYEHPSAIDHQDLTGDEAAGIAGQKSGCAN